MWMVQSNRRASERYIDLLHSVENTASNQVVCISKPVRVNFSVYITEV